MNFYSEAGKADEKMFTPAFKINNLLFSHPFFFNFSVACNSNYFFAFEWLHQFFQYNYGRTFRHLFVLNKLFKFCAMCNTMEVSQSRSIFHFEKF